MKILKGWKFSLWKHLLEVKSDNARIKIFKSIADLYQSNHFLKKPSKFSLYLLETIKFFKYYMV